jgi:hypothetical protein
MSFYSRHTKTSNKRKKTKSIKRRLNKHIGGAETVDIKQIELEATKGLEQEQFNNIFQQVSQGDNINGGKNGLEFKYPVMGQKYFFLADSNKIYYGKCDDINNESLDEDSKTVEFKFLVDGEEKYTRGPFYVLLNPNEQSYYRFDYNLLGDEGLSYLWGERIKIYDDNAVDISTRKKYRYPFVSESRLNSLIGEQLMYEVKPEELINGIFYYYKIPDYVDKDPDDQTKTTEFYRPGRYEYNDGGYKFDTLNRLVTGPFYKDSFSRYEMKSDDDINKRLEINYYPGFDMKKNNNYGIECSELERIYQITEIQHSKNTGSLFKIIKLENNREVCVYVFSMGKPRDREFWGNRGDGFKQKAYKMEYRIIPQLEYDDGSPSYYSGGGKRGGVYTKKKGTKKTKTKKGRRN